MSKRDLVDFKVAEKSEQIRLLMKCTDDESKFEFFGFSSKTGLMTGFFPYDSKVAEVPDMAE